ncbi:hypothetical protein [Absidia glauca]|uniref:Peptidase A2 domain-containing protein n=1 Tax=Absidia glauca TaxID=4829 RepID=A0A168NI45_ABSGL|nr:hypothetical protein [Absidia glauca]
MVTQDSGAPAEGVVVFLSDRKLYKPIVLLSVLIKHHPFVSLSIDLNLSNTSGVPPPLPKKFAEAEADKNGDVKMGSADSKYAKPDIKMQLNNLRSSKTGAGPIEWQDAQTGKAFRDSNLLAQAPIIQLAGLPRPNKDHPVYDSVSSYLRRFKKILEIHQVDPDLNWKLYLTYAMAGDDVDILMDKFSNKDRRIDSTMELFCLKMDASSESFTEFGLRLQHLCHEASWKDDLTTAMLCLRALPQVIKENVLVVYHSRSNKHDLPQTAEEVLKIASKLSKQKRSFQRDGDDALVKKSRVSSRPAKNLHCSYHGAASSHTTRDCRHLNSSNGFNSHQRGSHNQGTKAQSKLCRHCKKKASVRAIRHPADQAIENLNQGLLDIRMQAFDDPGKTSYGLHVHNLSKDAYTNKPYAFPLLLQNERAHGLLDTGAEISIVSHKFIESNKISIDPHNTRRLQLAGKDNILMGLGKTAPITVSFNNVTLKHQFEVIDLEDGIDCYIGDDLINLFNITVSNIPHQWPDQKLESAKENHNVDNPPEPNNSPAGTPEDHQEFMQAIQPYTDKNQMIPKTSFCPLDISIIRLETSTIPTNRTNHRQYPIALTLQPLVDEAVATWKEEGTIVDAPIDTTWNSPITLAPKKDEHGNVTGVVFGVLV